MTQLKFLFKAILLLILVIVLGIGFLYFLQPKEIQIDFTSKPLEEITFVRPTTMDFGPDNCLYIGQQDGAIFQLKLRKIGKHNYEILDSIQLMMIHDISNHDDNGEYNELVKSRQMTGLLVEGTQSNPVIYVSSSDPRHGGEKDAVDTNLDTNSGIISRISFSNGEWTKQDLVLGLPRNEENHSTNGLQLDKEKRMLYAAQGGMTNAGSPSKYFSYISEYALSGSILSIDLDMIDSMYNGTYILPTLDDPSRTNINDDLDINDPFGGNDGLNQAKLIENGPIQVFSPGFRNPYDLVLMKTDPWKDMIFTIDNGPNPSWGGHPKHEGTDSINNEYLEDEPGDLIPGPNDRRVNNLDNLHLVSRPGMKPIYGGHPSPIRANPASAGLHRKDELINKLIFEEKPTSDWPPVPVHLANSVESDYRNPGLDDNALFTFLFSTNGLAEYSSDNFGGTANGNIIAAAYNGDLWRIVLKESGDRVQKVVRIAKSYTPMPLDVAIPDKTSSFSGTIWSCSYVTGQLYVHEPKEKRNWQYFRDFSGSLTPRHECAFVEANNKFYLIGGRGNYPVEIFDPQEQKWTKGSQPPIELNHFQAVSHGKKIYIIGAFTGKFPNEKPVKWIYVYETDKDRWYREFEIPETRLRGAGGTAVIGDYIYFVGGLTNGHISGWSNKTDRYNIKTKEWESLPDAPRPRDHFQLAVWNNQIYAAGGRLTGKEGDLFSKTISTVDIYDVVKQEWSSLPKHLDLPTPRAGTTSISLGDEIIIIGGESGLQNMAHREVERYDVLTQKWTTGQNLKTGRHGTQVLSYKSNLYIASGSKNRGGGPELQDLEVYTCIKARPPIPEFIRDNLESMDIKAKKLMRNFRARF